MSRSSVRVRLLAPKETPVNRTFTGCFLYQCVSLTPWGIQGSICGFLQTMIEPIAVIFMLFSIEMLIKVLQIN